jgi:hypothetical protein
MMGTELQCWKSGVNLACGDMWRGREERQGQKLAWFRLRSQMTSIMMSWLVAAGGLRERTG